MFIYQVMYKEWNAFKSLNDMCNYERPLQICSFKKNEEKESYLSIFLHMIWEPMIFLAHISENFVSYATVKCFNEY